MAHSVIRYVREEIRSLEERLQDHAAMHADALQLVDRTAAGGLLALDRGDMEGVRDALSTLTQAGSDPDPRDLRVHGVRTSKDGGPAIVVLYPWAVRLLVQSLAADLINNPAWNSAAYGVDCTARDDAGEPVRLEVTIQRCGRIRPSEQRAAAIAQARRLRLGVALYRLHRAYDGRGDASERGWDGHVYLTAECALTAWEKANGLLPPMALALLRGGIEALLDWPCDRVAPFVSEVLSAIDVLLAPPSPAPKPAPEPGTRCYIRASDGRVVCRDCGDEMDLPGGPKGAPLDTYRGALESFQSLHARCTGIVAGHDREP